MEKKNNHYIPKCLLKRWLTNNGRNNGVHVLDIPSKSIDYSSSNGRKAYSFASINNLYVLTKEDERLSNLENWFDGLENSLSLFIDKVSRKESDLFKHIGHMNKLIMSLASFKFRSRYLFEKGIQYLEQNPEIKNEFNGKSSFQIILENVVNGTTDLANQLFPVEFIVLESKVPILLCDRPLLFNLVDGYSFIALSPNQVLAFKKIKGESIIRYDSLDEKLSKSLNAITIDRARDWIVSFDKKELEQIKTDNKFDNFDDNIEFTEIKTLIKGFEY